MGSAPKPPAPQDPYEAANAQWATDLQGAKATQWFQNADEDRPDGSVRFIDSLDAAGNPIELEVYTFDSNGDLKSTENLRKPKKVVTLSTDKQTQFDQQQQIGIHLNQWALTQLGIMQGLQVAPITAADLDPRRDIGATPTLAAPAIIAGALQGGIGQADLETHYGDVKTALFARLTPEIERARTREIVRLSQMGLEPGMEAYDLAMDDLNRKSTDAEMQATLEARNEQNRIVQLEGYIADHTNKVQSLKFQQDVAIYQLTNDNILQQFKLGVDAAEYINLLRERQLQERIAIRSGNINEVTALMHGGQVNIPQFQPWRGGSIKGAPIMQAMYQTKAQEMEIWKSQVASQQQMMGGLLGFGGNMLGGMMALSDIRTKRDIVRVADDPRGFGWYRYRYYWEEVGTEHIGVMAQELLEHIPEAVVYMPNGLLAVNYGRVLH